VTDIRDVDPEEESAVLLIRIDAVVDVLRVLAVDRDDGLVDELSAADLLPLSEIEDALRAEGRS